MKQILFSFSLLLGLASQAQTLSFENQSFVNGDYSYKAIDTTSTLEFNDLKESKSEYNFASMQKDSVFIETFYSITNENIQQQVPEADILNNGDAIPLYVDMRTDGIFNIATSYNDSVIYFDQEEAIVLFPSAISTQWNNSSDLEIEIPINQEVAPGVFIEKARISRFIQKDVNFQDITNIITPMGRFANVLKERREQIMEITFEACVSISGLPCQYQSAEDFGFPDTRDSSVIYNFWHPEVQFPVASIKLSLDEARLIELAYNGDNKISESADNNTAVTETKHELAIYPNPASTTIGFDSEIEDYTILNMNGQIVKQESNISTTTISISNLEKGNYIILVNQHNQTAWAKFAKQ